MPRSTRLSRLVLTGSALALALGMPGASPAAASLSTQSVSPAATGLVRGADISWPQCPVGMGIPARRTLGLPLPGAKATFVVVGLTNGPAFTPNPCLGWQVEWAQGRGLPISAYAVATYPTTRQLARHSQSGPFAGTTHRSRLRNVGYAQGRYNMGRLASVGLTVPHVWIDVEHYSIRPWTKDRRANRAVVRGIVRAYQDAGISTGFYSTSLQWPQIVGKASWGLPEWHTAGPRSKAVALSRCTEPSFQGGPTVLAQWWTDRRDHDIVCPTGPASTGLTGFFAAS